MLQKWEAVSHYLIIEAQPHNINEHIGHFIDLSQIWQLSTVMLIDLAPPNISNRDIQSSNTFTPNYQINKKQDFFEQFRSINNMIIIRKIGWDPIN